MIRTLHWVLLAAANGLLLLGFFVSDKLLELPMAFLPIPFYVLGVVRGRWGWMRTLAFCFLTGTILFGLWRGVDPFLPLLSLTAGLLAYDVDHARRRWATISYQPRQKEMEQLYLQRLALLAVAGVGLSAAAMFITIQLSLFTAIFLGLLTMLGLSRAVAYLRRESD